MEEEFKEEQELAKKTRVAPAAIRFRTWGSLTIALGPHGFAWALASTFKTENYKNVLPLLTTEQLQQIYIKIEEELTDAKRRK